MFGRFFQRFQAATVEDPVFGRLTNDKRGCWTGRTLFAPLGREIDLVFRLTVTTPPTQEHRDFFGSIVDEWPRIYQSLGETLFEGIDDWEEGTTMEQVFNSLRFEAFEFLDLNTRPRYWEIGATTP